MTDSIKIITAFRHPFVHEGIKRAFDKYPQYIFLKPCSVWETLHYEIPILKPRIVLIGKLHEGWPISKICRLREGLKLDFKIVVLTMDTNLDIFIESVGYGVDGYLYKFCPKQELVDCLETVVKGEKYLKLAIK